MGDDRWDCSTRPKRLLSRRVRRSPRSRQDYADLARDAQSRGVNNEAGMITLAKERGWDPADTKAALDGWAQRMGQSMAVGQQFRRYLGY